MKRVDACVNSVWEGCSTSVSSLDEKGGCLCEQWVGWV